MSATVTINQKAFLQDLLSRGPWRNESEIIRYGLELVRRELERQDLSALPEDTCRVTYQQMSEEELQEDVALGDGSIRAQADETMGHV